MSSVNKKKLARKARFLNRVIQDCNVMQHLQFTSVRNRSLNAVGNSIDAFSCVVNETLASLILTEQ